MAQLIMGSRYAERMQLASGYITRDWDLKNEEIKQPQRDRVLAHIKQFHAAKAVRLFSLPAARWTFEDQFLRVFPNAQLIALERNFEIYRNGITFMPGRDKHRANETLKTGHLLGHWSSQAKVLWCDAATFMETGRTELMTKHRRREWTRNYKNWTCAWWDFMSKLGPEAFAAVMKTEWCLDPQVASCPVSFTLFVGREDRETGLLMRNIVREDVDPVERRVLALQRWLNKFNKHRRVEVVEYFPYLSETNCRMVLINTLFKLRGADG